MILRLLTLLLLATATAVSAQDVKKASEPMARPWLDALWPPAAQVRFQPTTLEERELFGRLVPGILQAVPSTRTPPKALTSIAAKASFILEAWRDGDETFWTLREASARYRGAGAYVFRTGPAADVIIQAPHADYDLGTGALGAQLFLTGTPGNRPRAFFTNTAHRYKSHPEERREDPEHPADVAHNADHLFQITTDLSVRTLDSARVIQLHGFGASDNKSREALAAVVSAGTELPSEWSAAVAERLKQSLGEGVRLYPRDTRILGGTQNVQGRLIRTYPNARFLHLELSADVRKQLAEPERMNALCRALLDPITDESTP